MTTEQQRAVEPGPAGADERPGAWQQLRPLVLRLHFYAGVLIAPFVLVAAVTGLAYTTTPQLERIVYSDLLEAPRQAGQPSVPLSEQVASARRSHPDGVVTEVDPPEGPGRTTRVVFTEEGLPADYARSVFVDPQTAEVLGEVKSYGQWLGVRAWIDELHRNLHLGAVGRSYSELAASWVWVVVLGGLALWFGRRRRDRRARRLLLPTRQGGARARAMSWHATVALWVSVGLVGLSISGLTWSRFAGENIGVVRTALQWQSPALATTLDEEQAGLAAGDEHAGHGDDHGAEATSEDPGALDAVLEDGVGIDGVLRTARAEGLGDPLVLTPPAEAGTAWTASENKRSWPTRYDSIAVDGSDGSVVSRVDFAEWPFMAKMTDWIIGLHMGILFGLVNQIGLAALAIGLIVVIVQGYRMWWLRRPGGAGRGRFGRPARRGTWWSLSPGLLATVVAVTAVVAVAVPLLGASLAIFLLLDVAIGARAGRDRERVAAGPSETDPPEGTLDEQRLPASR